MCTQLTALMQRVSCGSADMFNVDKIVINFTMALTKNKVKEFRERAGLSQEKLAALAGVTRQTIISIEGGRYVPSLELALKFAKIFRCKVEDLFGL